LQSVLLLFGHPFLLRELEKLYKGNFPASTMGEFISGNPDECLILPLFTGF
jgi:hypothetical protein